MGQSSTSSSSWERCRRKPTAPFRSTATRTRLRQSQPADVPLDGLDLHRALQAGDPRQLLGHPERLEPALGAELHVLEVAAPAAPRAGVRARRRDAVGRGRQDLHGVGPQVPGGGGGDPGDDPLTRQGVAHEDDPPVGCPAHAAAAGGDGADLELQESGVARGSHGGQRTVGHREGWEQKGVAAGHGRRRGGTRVKIFPAGCRSGRVPIVVGATPTQPGGPMRYLLMIAGDESPDPGARLSRARP